jgi:hypothetical protein
MAAIHRQEKIGQATVTFYKLSDGYEVIAHNLKEGFEGHPPCSACPVRPRVCEWTVKE